MPEFPEALISGQLKVSKIREGIHHKKHKMTKNT
jgi:hypothetical protein